MSKTDYVPKSREAIVSVSPPPKYDPTTPSKVESTLRVGEESKVDGAGCATF